MRKLLVIVLLALSGSCYAIHIKGGWIYYEYLGKDPADTTKLQYRISVKVYRDCAVPGQLQNDPQINISYFDASNNQLINTFQAPLIQIYPLRKTTPNPCITGDQEVCYSILFYQTTFSFPASAAGYILSFQRCCRIAGIINVVPFSNDVGNTYSTTIPGTAADLNFPENNSPLFVEQDTFLVCYNNFFSLNYAAQDADGDSLAYEFCAAFPGGNPSATGAAPNPASNPLYNSINYQSPYTALQPMGAGVTINRATGIISGMAPSTTGEYVVSVCVNEYRGGQFVGTTRKELHVKVAACTPTAAVPPPDFTTCDGFNVTFIDGSFGNITNWFWDFGVSGTNADTSTQINPVWVYADTGRYRVKLRITSAGGCVDSAYTNVGVYPGFFPGFVNDPACANQPMQFRDTTRTRYGIVNKWRWDFGVPTSNADTSIQQNPRFNYPAAGPFNVQFIVSSNKGCKDTVTKTITVLDKPPLNLPFHDTLICSIDTLPLIANGVGTFTWTPNVNILNANTANPLVWPVDSITYFVTLNRNGCVSKDSIKVNVLDFITVDAGPDTTICLTDRVQLNPITQALSFRWTPGVPLLDNPRIKRPFAKPTAVSTVYTLQANLGKCQAKDSVTIFTSPYPVANVLGDKDTICFGERIQLNGQIVGDRFTWTPIATLDNPNVLNPFASPRNTTNYILTAYNSTGCPKPFRDTIQIRVIPQVKPFAGNDTSIVIGQSLQLFGTGGGSYQWSPGRFLNFTNINNPIANILDPAIDTFRYFLTVTKEGCSATDDILVKVFKTPPSIFVPSAFTPDGDGLNDRIRPIIVGMKTLDYFRIFNRWGQLVYESNYTKLLGWDGNIDGTPQKSEVYVYTAQATDFNNKVVVVKGTILLIR
jgi:gliding motility-associated-like protein